MLNLKSLISKKYSYFNTQNKKKILFFIINENKKILFSLISVRIKRHEEDKKNKFPF